MNKTFLLTLLVVLLGFLRIGAQTTPATSDPRDPFFAPKSQQEQASKVQHIHSDESGVKPDQYEGNLVFSGHVKFEHQGSILTADKVVLYQKENFLKAIGNVTLLNADGTQITAEEMEYDGNTQRGIARKNVVLTDPKQTIKTETLYYDRVPNTAYFNTGGTITDGQNIMYTKSATYYVTTKDIDFVGHSTIDAKDYTIESDNIKTNQATQISRFLAATTIRSKANPRNYVYTELGDYDGKTGISHLKKNSRIYYNDKILTGDDLIYNRNTGFGKGTGNIKLDDPKEKRFIKGGYGEIYELKDSAMITNKPYAVKIFEKDSMYIAAEKFLSFQKADSTKQKKSFLRAYQKVRIFKTNMQARADSLSYNETDGILHLMKKPILWTGTKQVTGDEVMVYMNTTTQDIDSIKVIGNAFAISKVDSLNMKDEFHQIKSKWMGIYFDKGQIKKAVAVQNAQSIAYADDKNETTQEITRIGVAVSVCGEIAADFIEKRLETVTCRVGAQSDIYPMSFMSKEKRFFPDFNWNTKDRPQKYQDIFEDTPNYPETVYESDNSLYEKAEAERLKQEEKNKPKTPVREKR
ncbi:OstA-like protein [Soonwooa sp.]|uniref:OstA-like protein n=1 Tax=Soonwooa sp. TaxID=1938592 RepID=UPI00262D7C5C|nr:OstA-like protein [Soonwooa sp.]